MFVELLSLRALALGLEPQPEVAQAHGLIVMIRAAGLLRNRQRAFVKRLSLRVMALVSRGRSCSGSLNIDLAREQARQQKVPGAPEVFYLA